MNIELNDIKEVEIVAKKEFKYFMLFVCNSETKDPYNKYYMIRQSPYIVDIEEAKKSWTLEKGDEFRVISVMLPI